jgi:hypothetical protein
VKLAAQESKKENASDDWDRIESEALEHLVHTLEIVGLGFALQRSVPILPTPLWR